MMTGHKTVPAERKEVHKKFHQFRVFTKASLKQHLYIVKLQLLQTFFHSLLKNENEKRNNVVK